MTRSAVLLSLCVILGACTTIRINGDDTSIIEHEGGVEVAKDPLERAGELANRVPKSYRQ